MCISTSPNAVSGPKRRRRDTMRSCNQSAREHATISTMPSGDNRDEFAPNAKRQLALRVQYCCSNPSCRAPTVGPQEDPEGTLNLGVAAHITAAAPGGPRHNHALTPDGRKAIANGLWLCQNCAKLIDNDPIRFTELKLRQWKSSAEKWASDHVGMRAGTFSARIPTFSRFLRRLRSTATSIRATWPAIGHH